MFRFIKDAVRVYRIILSWHGGDIIGCTCRPRIGTVGWADQVWRVHDWSRCNHPNELLAEKGEVGGGPL